MGSEIMKLDPRMKDALILGLAFSFMMAIFAPLDAYMANADEFWFGLKDLFPIISGAFIVCFCVFGLLFYASRKSKLFLGLYSFLLSAYVYFYLQGNYAPRKYGVLDGRTINWSAYESYGMISLALILICLVFWGVSVLKLRDRVYKIGRYIAAFLLLIQISTLGILLVQKVILEPEDKGPVTVTDKGLLELSKNRNIIVFILDTFDSAYMEKMLESPYAERTKAIFKDFTYYADTIGAYPTTKGAIPFILTGQWYENEKPYKNYIQEAYQNAKRFKALKDNDFSVGIYTRSDMLSLIDGDFVNVTTSDYSVKNSRGFFEKLCRLVAFNYMPHQVKRFFYIATDEFDKHREIQEGSARKEENVAAYSMETQDFYTNFMKKPMTLSEHNAFRFYHVWGVHPPWTFGRDLTSKEGKRYTVQDEAEGCFTLLEAYMKRLKESGIYNNSTIVVMADHGNSEISHRPLFMIKNAGQSHEFRVSNQKMSWAYLDDMFIALAKNETVDDAFFDVCAKKNNGERRFLFYSWQDEGWSQKYLPQIAELYFSGDSTEWAKMSFSGRVFEPKGKASGKHYKLGEELFFERQNATANPYCLFGFSGNETKSTWTLGHVSGMQFNLDEKFEDLLVEIQCSSFRKQRVELYANDHLIANFTAEGEKQQTFRIPHEDVTDGRLMLRFYFPDAASPLSKGEGNDPRILALSMKTIKLSSVPTGTAQPVQAPQATPPPPKTAQFTSRQYILGEAVFFDKARATANRYILEGFSGNEMNGTWTEGRTATMEFDLGRTTGDLMLAMEYHSYGRQRVEVYANDKRIGEFVADGDATKTLPIPQDVLTSGKLTLRFALPDAISPKAQGKGADGRDLALYLKSMKISAASG